MLRLMGKFKIEFNLFSPDITHTAQARPFLSEESSFLTNWKRVFILLFLLYQGYSYFQTFMIWIQGTAIKVIHGR